MIATTIKIIQGEDFTLKLYLRDPSGLPIDLTALTAAAVKMKKADETVFTATLTVVGDAKLGALSVPIEDADTLLLRLGEKQGMTVVLDFGTTRRIVNFDKAVTIEEPNVALS